VGCLNFYPSTQTDTTISEGSIRLILPSRNEIPRKDPAVFYNPKMTLNRDIAILVARCVQHNFSQLLRVADPLTGSGIRGLRYAGEVENVDRVFLNDIQPSSASAAHQNAIENKLVGKVDIQCMDANLFLNLHSVPGKRFHIVDLDPYGSPSPYFDSAVRALVNGGMLAATATDMAVLCGVKPRACLRKYGGRPLRCEYSREVSLRLLFGSLVTTASKHSMAIEVKFSHSTDHYIRIYAELTRSARSADKNLEEMGYIFHCFNCLKRFTSRDPSEYRRCLGCDSTTTSAGPLFLGKLTDGEFCRRLIDIQESNERPSNRIHKIFLLELEEADSPPTYYTVDSICRRIGRAPPSPSAVVEALKAEGFKATRTHFDGRAFKTDAPSERIETLIKRMV
jgi:tRNA (guanine26-N2/guanine27-N2)-dimethyltransferase